MVASIMAYSMSGSSDTASNSRPSPSRGSARTNRSIQSLNHNQAPMRILNPNGGGSPKNKIAQTRGGNRGPVQNSRARDPPPARAPLLGGRGSRGAHQRGGGGEGGSKKFPKGGGERGGRPPPRGGGAPFL